MVNSPEEAIFAVLADQATQLRAKFPDLYARVDAILADPDRDQSEQQFKNTIDDAWVARHTRECAWCGNDFFVAKPTRGQATCSNRCRNFYRGYLRRRATST